MASQSVDALLEESAPAGGSIAARLLLACGCPVATHLPDDRILDGADGRRFVVGKVPCPAGHPVGHGRGRATAEAARSDSKETK
jgi:hypothetical protein